MINLNQLNLWGNANTTNNGLPQEKEKSPLKETTQKLMAEQNSPTKTESTSKIFNTSVRGAENKQPSQTPRNIVKRNLLASLDSAETKSDPLINSDTLTNNVAKKQCVNNNNLLASSETISTSKNPSKVNPKRNLFPSLMEVEKNSPHDEQQSISTPLNNNIRRNLFPGTEHTNDYSNEFGINTSNVYIKYARDSDPSTVGLFPYAKPSNDCEQFDLPFSLESTNPQRKPRTHNNPSRISKNLFGSPTDISKTSESIKPEDVNPSKAANNISVPEKEIHWGEKNPAICDGSITINDVKYPIEKLGNGKNQMAYKFTTSAYITIGDQVLCTDDIVLKVLLPTAATGFRKKMEKHNQTQKGYLHLIENKVTVAKVFVDPMTFKDTHDKKNGGFWLVQKCPYKISAKPWKLGQKFDALDTESKNILIWVKDFLKETAITKKEIINDFRKDNVMLDHSRTPTIIDYSPPEKTGSWDIKFHLFAYLKDWSRGNKNIFEFLILGFPKEIEVEMREQFANEQFISNK